jgi:hypothetical protein
VSDIEIFSEGGALGSGRESRGDCLLRLRAGDSINHHSVLEDQHRGNTVDLILIRYPRIFIDVQFGNQVPSI